MADRQIIATVTSNVLWQQTPKQLVATVTSNVLWQETPRQKVSTVTVMVLYQEPPTEPDSQARYMRHGKWFNDYGEQEFWWAK